MRIGLHTHPNLRPKRSGDASSSGQPQLSADQRLEEMLRRHNMEVTSREHGRIAGINLVGSPPRRNVSPSMALKNELTSKGVDTDLPK